MATIPSNKVAQLVTDVDILHNVVHGGPEVVVATEGGEVRSVANLINQLSEQVNDASNSILSQVTAIKDTVVAAANSVSGTGSAAANSSVLAQAAATSAATYRDSAQAAATLVVSKTDDAVAAAQSSVSARDTAVAASTAATTAAGTAASKATAAASSQAAAEQSAASAAAAATILSGVQPGATKNRVFIQQGTPTYEDGAIWLKIDANGNPLALYIANGAGAYVLTLKIDQLVTDLNGKLTQSQLVTSLSNQIDLISAAASVSGSVNQRLQTESTNRATAISSAISGLSTTLTANYQAADSVVDSRVTTEVGLSKDRDNALGVRVDTVSARLNTGDIATAIATALSYAYSKAAADAAIAASANTLTTAYQTADGTLNTRITNEANASSGRDGALGTRIDDVSARLNTGDIATALAQALTYAYTKAATDGAISAMGTTLRSEFNPINNRLNAGGDVYNALATANSYAYTKAATDGAIATATNAISARLNSGGDIAVSIASAQSYSYTKATIDSAIAASLSTARAEYGPYSGQISSLQQVVSGANGLTSQYVFKVSAVRNDGVPVFGMIGLSATAPSSGSGASQVVLAADSLVFVPSSNPNATPVGMLEVGVVDGVTTLRVPAGRIGDLSVSTLKIADRAVTVPIGAGLSGDWSLSASYTEQTMLYGGSLDTGGQPVFIVASVKYLANSSSTGNDFEIRVKINGATVATMAFSLAPSSYVINGTAFTAPLISSPGSGPLSISMVVYSNGGTFTAKAGTSILALGCKK